MRMVSVSSVSIEVDGACGVDRGRSFSGWKDKAQSLFGN